MMQKSEISDIWSKEWFLEMSLKLRIVMYVNVNVLSKESKIRKSAKRVPQHPSHVVQSKESTSYVSSSSTDPNNFHNF
jgi:hypothetical protein